MQKIIQLMSLELEKAFENAGYDPQYAKVVVSNRPDLCEFQCNGARKSIKRLLLKLQKM